MRCNEDVWMIRSLVGMRILDIWKILIKAQPANDEMFIREKHELQQRPSVNNAMRYQLIY